MSFDNSWGRVYVMVYLTNAEITKYYVRERLDEIPGLISIFATHETIEQQIRMLDTPAVKTIAFMTHGILDNAGLIGMDSDGSGIFNLLTTLKALDHPHAISLDFMSTCYQHNIKLPNFRHVLTTSEKIKKSVVGQGLLHSVEVYGVPVSHGTVEKGGNYKLHQ